VVKLLVVAWRPKPVPMPSAAAEYGEAAKVQTRGFQTDEKAGDEDDISSVVRSRT